MGKKLFILEAKEDLEHSPWKSWCDKTFGMVVRAVSAKKAREIAADSHNDEGREAWLNPEFSSCEELKTTGKTEVIISDDHWA